jgi:hypothetical protein
VKHGDFNGDANISRFHPPRCSLLAGTQRGDAVAIRVSGNQDAAPVASPVVLRIDRRDKMTAKQLTQLRGGSATARELLVRVANLRDTILIVRADPRSLAGHASTDGAASGCTAASCSDTSSIRREL